MPLKLPVTNRYCGECTACCTVIGVPELGKTYYQRCKRLTDHGCGRYKERPGSCKTYKCLWLQGMGKTRPDQLGVIVSPTHHPHLCCFETRPGGWENARDELIEIVKRLPRYRGIELTRYGSRVPIDYPVSDCYENRGECGLKIDFTRSEMLDGLEVRFNEHLL